MTANARAAALGGVADGRAKRRARTEGRPSFPPRLFARFRRVGERRRLQAIGSGSAPIYQAAAALPHQNRGRATEGLRDQLTIMALASGLTPDWSTLAVTGPTEMTGTQHEARFEWTGCVAMRGLSPLVALPDPDALPQHPAANGDTMPFRVESSWNRPGWPELLGSTQAPDRRSPSEIAPCAAAQQAGGCRIPSATRIEGVAPMTREQLHTRLGGEPAERLTPLSAGAADQAIQRVRAGADLLRNANRQAGAVARPVTDIAARLHRALDGA